MQDVGDKLRLASKQNLKWNIVFQMMFSRRKYRKSLHTPDIDKSMMII